MNRAMVHGLIFSVGGLIWAGALALRGAPPAPALLRPPHDPSAADRSVRVFQERAQADPRGALDRALLAAALLHRFQEQGDPADLARADAAARQSLAIRHRNNAAALQALVRCRMARHRFDQALPLLARFPADDLGAAPLRVECLIELGRYDDARARLGDALVLRPDDPSLKTLSARLWEIDGRPDRAEGLYREALALAERSFEIPRPTLAWFQTRLAANLALQGRRDAAEAQYDAALTTYPDDPRALLGLARLRAGDGDDSGARELAERAASRQPSAEAVLLLAELARRRGDQAEASRQEARALGDGGAAHAHGRTLALYLAGRGQRLDEALRYALADVARRPDIYSFDTLAWVRLARGEVAAAVDASRRARSRGTRDPQLLYRAGRIALAAGRRDDAARLLSAALAIDPRFDSVDAPAARTLREKL